jgi:hypothetical protein
MRRFDLAGSWAYHAVSESRCFGLTRTQLQDLYRSAAAIINLHGSHVATDEMTANNRLVYLETDPVEVEVDLYHGKRETFAYLRPHCAFFTFGETIGQPGSLVPAPTQLQFRPTRQPVVLDFWKDHESGDRGRVYDRRKLAAAYRVLYSSKASSTTGANISNFKSSSSFRGG